MSRWLDVLAPPRLGRDFRLLMASSWTSNVGDGIALAAGPLLVASKTDHAFLVAMAALGQLSHIAHDDEDVPAAS